MSIKADILVAILEADRPVSSNEIAIRAGYRRKTVTSYLTIIYRDGLVDRKKGGGRSFLYFRKEGSEEKIEGMIEDAAARETESVIQLPGDDDVAAAIERTRPTWGKARPNLRETRFCNRCSYKLTFEPWYDSWLSCPRCGWIVYRREQ